MLDHYEEKEAHIPVKKVISKFFKSNQTDENQPSRIKRVTTGATMLDNKYKEIDK